MLSFCDFIQVYVFTTNHNLKLAETVSPVAWTFGVQLIVFFYSDFQYLGISGTHNTLFLSSPHLLTHHRHYFLYFISYVD